MGWWACSGPRRFFGSGPGEPSGVAKLIIRASGVLFIAGAVGVAGSIVVGEVHIAIVTKRRDRELKQPSERGELPVVGYRLAAGAPADVTVRVGLRWEPSESKFDELFFTTVCNAEVSRYPDSRVACAVVGRTTGITAVRTGSAIVTPTGEVVREAGAGNEVPRLQDPPAGARMCSPATVDRP